jgi:hypothetical protein
MCCPGTARALALKERTGARGACAGAAQTVERNGEAHWRCISSVELRQKVSAVQRNESYCTM